SPVAAGDESLRPAQGLGVAVGDIEQVDERLTVAGVGQPADGVAHLVGGAAGCDVDPDDGADPGRVPAGLLGGGVDQPPLAGQCGGIDTVGDHHRGQPAV